VKFPPFDYVRPATLADALDALQAEESRVLAGGQSLLPLLALRLSRPELLVDIGRLSEIAGVGYDPRSARLTVGAATTHRYIAEDPVIARHAPFLAAAAAHIGHQAIRSRGTIGGSIAHCDPAAEWPAVAIALGATVHLRSRHATRRVAAADFIDGPYTTSIKPGEMLTAVEFDLSARPVVGMAETSRRPGDFAMAGAVCAAGGGSAASLTLFGVTSSPVRHELLGDCGDSVLKAEAHEWIDSLDRVTEDAHASAALRIHLAKRMTDQALAVMQAGTEQNRRGHSDGD